jgi:hypothetical protein
MIELYDRMIGWKEGGIRWGFYTRLGTLGLRPLRKGLRLQALRQKHDGLGLHAKAETLRLRPPRGGQDSRP